MFMLNFSNHLNNHLALALQVIASKSHSLKSEAVIFDFIHKLAIRKYQVPSIMPSIKVSLKI